MPHVQRDQAAQVDRPPPRSPRRRAVRPRPARVGTVDGERDDRDVGAGARRRAPGPAAPRDPGGAGSPLLANSPLCSKKTTGSSLRIAEAIRPTTSAGVDGAAIFSPGTVERPVLHGLRVLGAEAEAAAVGGAHHQRHGHLPAGHVPHLGDLVGEVVPAAGEEVGEHDLGDRPHPGHGGAHGRARRSPARRSGVSQTRRGPNSLNSPTVVLNTPSGGADVLAQADHASGRGASPGRCPRRPPRGR